MLKPVLFARRGGHEGDHPTQPRRAEQPWYRCKL